MDAFQTGTQLGLGRQKMPAVPPQRGEPPRKRVKLDADSRASHTFANVGQIRASLRSQHQDGLTEGTPWFTHLSVHAHKSFSFDRIAEPIHRQDE